VGNGTEQGKGGRGGERKDGKGQQEGDTLWFLFTPPDIKSWIKQCF